MGNYRASSFQLARSARLILALHTSHRAFCDVCEPRRSASQRTHGKHRHVCASLDDPLWQLANPISDFRQREPYEGRSPTEKTEVRVLYTRHKVYFGVICYDSEPKSIVATELRRDLPQDLDDYFEILIDST